MELLNTLEGEARQQASRELCTRLPDPYLAGALEKRNPFEDGRESYRSWLVANAWDGSLDDEVRATAARLLNDDDSNWVATGAYLLECVGTIDDAAPIIAALDCEVPKTKSLALRTDIFPRPRGACMELQRAARMMRLRGADIPTHPESPGEAMLFLIALSHDESFRPEGWIKTCGQLLDSDVPYLVEQALNSLPAPMPSELHPKLLKILADDDVDASRAACRIVGRDKLTAFKQPILDVLRRSTEHWQFSAASDAAVELGAHYERLVILVDRLDEKGTVHLGESGMLFECLDGLKSIFGNVGGHSANSNIDLAAEAQRIKPLWRALLVKHRDDFQSGGKLTLPHPDVVPEMFPVLYRLTLRTGGEWPPASE